MPLKYFCPKCEKRFVDWGAEKLGFKCPDCPDETLYRVGTLPEGESAAPSLSKSAAKRKVKPRVKVGVEEGEFEAEFSSGIDDDTEAIVDDVDIDEDGESDVLGDSLAIDDD